MNRPSPLAWWLPVGSCVCLALINGLTFWGFGLYVEPLEDEFGWSRSFLSGAVTLTMLFSGIASPLVGRLVDAWSPRRVILIGTLATSVSFLGLSVIQSAWQFIALLIVMAFFRTWVDYVPFTTLVARRFVHRGARAMAITTCGFGLGGLAVLPLLAEVIERSNWRSAFFISGLLLLVTNSLVLVALRERRTLTLVDSRGTDEDEGIIRNRDARGPLRSAAFWAMAGGFSLFFCAQWAFLFHAIPFFEGEGMDARHASWMLSAAGGIGIAVRLGAGMYIDRGGSLERTAAAVMLVMAAALALLVTESFPVVLLCFVILWGIGSGIGPLLEPLVVARLFGRRRYASVYGAADGLDSGVSIFGPLAGGVLYDLSGSYEPVLMLYLGLFVAGGLCFMALSRLIASNEISRVRGEPRVVALAVATPATISAERRSWVPVLIGAAGFGVIASATYAVHRRRRAKRVA
jgi:MFS family permease